MCLLGIVVKGKGLIVELLQYEVLIENLLMFQVFGKLR